MRTSRSRPCRILQVIDTLGRGGIETWLMSVLRIMDRSRYGIDFLVQTGVPSLFGEEVRSYGSRIHVCPLPRNPWVYGRGFLGVLRSEGPYDVVHCHVQHFSAVPLLLAKVGGVPVRIGHSHGDLREVKGRASVVRRLYYRLTTAIIRRSATVRVGCSEDAAACLFGGDGGNRVQYCGIDTDVFRQSRTAARRAALRGEVEGLVRHRGLSQDVVFAGDRGDVPDLLCQAFDLLVLPSLYEGLSLVLIEAQAAGLRCVTSTAPDAACVVPGVLRRLSLDQSAAAWADAIIATAEQPRVEWEAALEQVVGSPFSIESSVRNLSALYDGCVQGS